MILSDSELVCPCPLRLDHIGYDYKPQDGGFIYVMGIWDHQKNNLGKSKIGISNCPPYRLRQIRDEIDKTDQPWRVSVFLYLTVRAGNVFVLERNAHHRLRRKRAFGEWFSCDVDEAAKVVLAVHKRMGRAPRREAWEPC